MRHTPKSLLCLALLLLFGSAGAARGGEAASAPERVQPLPIGSEVPELSLPEASGDIFDLHSAVVNQPTVLIFYRGGW